MSQFDWGQGLLGAGLGLGGSLMSGLGGSGKAARNQIAPGLSKYTAERESNRATDYARGALQKYTDQMMALTGQGQQTGQDMLAMFANYYKRLQAGQRGLQDQASRATTEVGRVYKDYGRQAESNSRDNYARALADIQDRQAIARARSGGINSGQDMIAAGARGEALYGLNKNLADIGQARAELYGGALERGRNQELNVGQAGQAMNQNLLNTQLRVRESAFQIPAAYQQAMVNTQLNNRLSPTFLYPNRNLQLALGGGSRSPLAENPMTQAAGSLQGIGGYLFGNAFPPPNQYGGWNASQGAYGYGPPSGGR